MNQPHPMLFPVRELLRRGLDRELHRLEFAVRYFPELDYICALDVLIDVLRDHGQAAVELTPGFTICRRRWRYAVHGGYHTARMPDGREVHKRRQTSFHLFRRSAERAGNAWLKRAQIVSSRIATELSQALEGAR